MAALCDQIAGAIENNSAACDAMGRDLRGIIDPNGDLVDAYQTSAVSKTEDRPFLEAEVHCSRALPLPTLKKFWACKDDPNVEATFRRMGSLKP